MLQHDLVAQEFVEGVVEVAHNIDRNVGTQVPTHEQLHEGQENILEHFVI